MSSATVRKTPFEDVEVTRNQDQYGGAASNVDKAKILVTGVAGANQKSEPTKRCGNSFDAGPP
eukprot:5385901-Pyramimonas_sp.AAC.1